jgi:hypothetical protein
LDASKAATWDVQRAGNLEHLQVELRDGMSVAQMDALRAD